MLSIAFVFVRKSTFLAPNLCAIVRQTNDFPSLILSPMYSRLYSLNILSPFSTHTCWWGNSFISFPILQFIHIPTVTKQPSGVIPASAAWAYFPNFVVKVKEQLLFFCWGHCLRIVFVEIRAAVSF